MTESLALENLIGRFLENRESLSDQEFRQLLETLRTNPALAEVWKDHLLMDEILAQQFQMDRKDFLGKFEARLREENGLALIEPAASSETYALRWSESSAAKTSLADTQESKRSEENLQSAGSTNPNPTRDTGSTISHVPNSSNRERRMLLALFAGVVLTAMAFACFEYTDAARRIAQLDEVQGMAFVYRGELGIVAAPGMPILPGDEIRVEAESQVSLRFRDLSRMRLGKESRVVLRPGQGRWPGLIAHQLPSEISVIAGHLEAKIEPQPVGRSMRIMTPRFEAKILGTRLIVNVNERQSHLELLDGRVEIASSGQNDSPSEVLAGHQVVADNQGLRISPGEWPVNKSGLIFLLSPLAKFTQSANQGVQLFAEGANGTPSVLRPRKEARFENGRLRFQGGAFLVDDSSALEILETCHATNAFALEATFQISERLPQELARWISFSTEAEEGNLALEQVGNRCVLRLRTTDAEGSNTFHTVPLFEIPDDQPHHVVVTYSPEELLCYLDGQAIELPAKVTGTLAGWNSQHLLFGNEWTGGREWRGELTGVAWYSRVLSPEEVERNTLHFRLRFPADGVISDSSAK